MSVFYKRWDRIPTPQEITEFVGRPGDSADRYSYAVRTSWCCPSCHRSAPECIRWTYVAETSWRADYRDKHGMGFAVNLRTYTCLAEYYGYMWRRFRPVLMCGDCIGAAKGLKRRLKTLIAFSFTPEELGSIVKCFPYSGKTEVHDDLARKVYESVQHTLFEQRDDL